MIIRPNAIPEAPRAPFAGLIGDDDGGLARRQELRSVKERMEDPLFRKQKQLDSTGGERWAEVWQTTADAVWEARDEDGLWTQRLFGSTGRSLGPAQDLRALPGRRTEAERRPV